MPEEPDYFARYLKDGVKAPEDAKLDPELQKTLAKLYERQKGEAQDLHMDHTGQKLAIGTFQHPKLNKSLSEETQRQDLRFVKERERYIREYHEAQKIRDQMRDNEISRDRGRTR